MCAFSVLSRLISAWHLAVSCNACIVSMVSRGMWWRNRGAELLEKEVLAIVCHGGQLRLDGLELLLGGFS